MGSPKVGHKGGVAMQKPLKLVMVLIAGFAFVAVNVVDADAANRKGSRRVYSGHGKGSYYVGGQKTTTKKTVGEK